MSLINTTFGISSPCKDCIKREVGCHSRCTDYIEYRKSLEDIRKTKQEERRFMSYHIDVVEKMRRRK